MELLANLAGINRSHLHRKVQVITGKNVSRLIRDYRLEKAKILLIEKEITPSEVWYQVGFKSLSYFSKCFKEYFGYPPSKIYSNISYFNNLIPKNKSLTLKDSLIVLPFKNLSQAKEIEYLAHGMAAAIGRDLSSIKKLNIVSSFGSTPGLPSKFGTYFLSHIIIFIHSNF